MNIIKDLPWQSQATLKFILMDAFCITKKNDWILHSQWGRKTKAPNHNITELNWKKKQLSKYRKNSFISSLFSLSTVMLSSLMYPLFFISGNFCMPIYCKFVSRKYLFLKEKNPALTQANLAAKLNSQRRQWEWPQYELGLILILQPSPLSLFSGIFQQLGRSGLSQGMAPTSVPSQVIV